MRTALALLFAAGTLTAAPVPKELKKPEPDDGKRILGKWNAVVAIVQGRPQLNAIEISFGADGTVTNGPGVSNLRYAIGPKAEPKQMTWTQKAGGNEWRVLYELDGDSLTVGILNPSTEAPFALAPGPDVPVFYRLTRAAPAK